MRPGDAPLWSVTSPHASSSLVSSLLHVRARGSSSTRREREHDAFRCVSDRCSGRRAETTRRNLRDRRLMTGPLRPTWRLHRRRHWNADRQVLKPRRRRLVEGCCDGSGGDGGGDGSDDRRVARARSNSKSVSFSCTFYVSLTPWRDRMWTSAKERREKRSVRCSCSFDGFFVL